MKRKLAECADCHVVKEIRARKLCSTCYSRRIYAGHRFDGPAPAVGTWGFTGPCITCGATGKDRYTRLQCRTCYSRWLARHKAQERWRRLDEYMEAYPWGADAPDR